MAGNIILFFTAYVNMITTMFEFNDVFTTLFSSYGPYGNNLSAAGEGFDTSPTSPERLVCTN